MASDSRGVRVSEVLYRIGDPVEPLIVPTPSRITLPGRTVDLAPVDPDAHASALFEETQGRSADPHMWDYMGYGPFSDLPHFTQALRGFAATDDPLWFACIDAPTGRAIGMGAYLRIDPTNRVIEIGHLCFGSTMQRATTATETIFLLLRHAFELGYRRVEWKCNDLNERSKRAALRFGFTPEGRFRNHMITKGRSRDTAWFSIIDSEWPAIEQAFEAWLSVDNFEANGRQRQPLITRSR